MASLSGTFHRPLSAVAAVAVAAVSSDLPDRFSHPRSTDHSIMDMPSSSSLSSPLKEPNSWVSYVSVSNISNILLASTLRKTSFDTSSKMGFSQPSQFPISSNLASLPAIHTIYQYARIAKPQQLSEFTSIPSSPSDALYKWHLPHPHTLELSGKSRCGAEKSKTVVVLLGWLGAKQKHLRMYAEWYTSRGFHVVTFTYPMAEVLSYNVGGKAEKNVDCLAKHLAGWVAEEDGKNLVFHTFSNTGWLTYGVILEKFQKQDASLVGRIKGCIVDSAPVASPDPQVWAAGFSTAFLKKQSVGTKGSLNATTSKLEPSNGYGSVAVPKPAPAESALLVILEKFFEVVLNLPSVNRRLSDVMDLLSFKQPNCPQLYIYSSSDRVIPAKSVESFIERQRRAGHEVKACDFVSSPHVDHFRNHPNLYASQLTTFLEQHVLTCCKDC